MIESKLVFRNEYRFDLKKVKSVIIPYLFDNEATLIISIEAKLSKNYRSAGTIEQSLIDSPGKLIASSRIVKFGNQELEFPQKGRFQLLFYPYSFLGKTTVKIRKLITPEVIPTSFQQDVLEGLNRIESRIDDFNNFEITEDADNS
ncbi:MAG: hypothetical protein KME31_27340 [Tolypothrix carrinoi HA7290-LM1]|jgi:hypothetical protein|nr:hypothetical protein [Tolypothrix carrinoi HA7290-LM1]